MKSLCCVPTTNVVLYVNYTSKNKLIEKEIKLIATSVGSWGRWGNGEMGLQGEGELDSQKVYTLAIR